MTQALHAKLVDTLSHQETVWLELVRRQVNSLQFGVVQIVVHDSRVTQIERTERVRLAQNSTETRSSDQRAGG